MIRKLEPSGDNLFSPRMIIRKSRISYFLILALLLLGIVVWGSLALELEGGYIIRFFLGFVAFICLLLFFLVFKKTIDLFKSSNWVIKLGDNSLQLHQIHENRKEEAAVEIPLSEIESVCKVTERRLGISDEGTESVKYKHVYLEMKVTASDTSLLNNFQSVVTLKNKSTIRIAWRDSVTMLTPSIKKFIDKLPMKISRLKDESTEWDTSLKLMDEEFINRVKTICEGGDKIGAIKLLRSRYKMGLAEAKEYVERLTE